MRGQSEGDDAGGATSVVGPSIDDWGEHGLLQVPSARFGADGDFNFTFSHVHPYNRYDIFVTALPWLEAGFRYTDITNRPYGPTDLSGSQSYKDRSIDLRVRLTRESASFPETALGIRDIGGTGLFSSEYLVATRRYHHFDFTVGLGWGLMASGVSLPNMFGVFGKSFEARPPANGAGNFQFDYFHGPRMGLFGGMEYRTPWKSVRLEAELDPDDYQNEPLDNRFHTLLPLNFAIVYEPYSFSQMSLGLERGNTLMLRISLLANFNSAGLYDDNSEPPKLVPRPEAPPPIGVPLAQSTIPRVTPDERIPQAEVGPLTRDIEPQWPDLPEPRHDMVAQLAARSPAPRAVSAAIAPALPAVTSFDEEVDARRIFADLAAIGFTGENFAMSGRHAWLAFSQNRYLLRTVAIGRAARIVARDIPRGVELITIDVVNDGLNVASVTLYRHDLEHAAAAEGSPEEIWANTTFHGADRDRPPGIVNASAYPRYSWSLNPQMRQELGGPDNFLIYQFYAALTGTMHVAPWQSFGASLGANLFNNLGALHQASDSTLPHVRSDINQYLKDGKAGIFRLQSDSFFNIAPNLYGRVSAGLLEEMFAGVDGEVLWRPYHRRWAIGLDLNHVYQRGFHELFGLRNYQVTSGQLTFYDKLPFYHLTAAVRIGRYLAGDKGFTVELSRKFAGDIRAGIFFTRTNVGASQFGEGSFDKGFMVSIPLQLFFGQPSTSMTNFIYRPLARDGGQMLDISKPLYDETDGYDPATLSQMWPHLLN